MKLTLECEEDNDGRWISEVPEIPGVLAYGATSSKAMVRAQALTLRVLADRLEHNEDQPLDLVLQRPVLA